MDIFTTGVLRRVVRALPAPAPFILNSFFTQEQFDTSEEIHFDVESDKRRISPFVAPIKAGQVVESLGYSTNTFKPAYIKDKRVFNAQRPLKRAIGEQPLGTLSPMQRVQLLLAGDLADQIKMLNRRLEVMAVEALRRGKVTIKGDGYPEVEVDFKRAASLTKTLTTTARWGETDVDPLSGIDGWALEVSAAGGGTPRTVVMDQKAFDLFSASEKVQALLDRFRGKEQLEATVGGHGAHYMGNVGKYDIWVYNDWYLHPETGAVTPYLPDHTVLLLSTEIEGTRCFASIQDEEAGFEAMNYFPKSWLEKDPSVRYLLLQSAPLMVPYRPNASLCATVR